MLIDSHCHLPHPKYQKSVDQLISEAKEEGVVKMINIGTSIEENFKALEISAQHEELYPTIGIYPHENIDITVEELKTHLEEMLRDHPETVAIGECGIDITERKPQRSIAEQAVVFLMQLALATEHALPIIVHNRNGDDLTLEALKKIQAVKGVIHCFSSSLSFAKDVLDLGFYISFSAIVTYPSARDLIEVVKYVPPDRMLVETDAPYLPPQGHRGEVNEPKYVKMVANRIAEVKNLSFEEICNLSYQNTCRVFNL